MQRTLRALSGAPARWYINTGIRTVWYIDGRAQLERAPGLRSNCCNSSGYSVLRVATLWVAPGALSAASLARSQSCSRGTAACASSYRTAVACAVPSPMTSLHLVLRQHPFNSRKHFVPRLLGIANRVGQGWRRLVRSGARAGTCSVPGACGPQHRADQHAASDGFFNAKTLSLLTAYLLLCKKLVTLVDYQEYSALSLHLIHNSRAWLHVTCRQATPPIRNHVP